MATYLYIILGTFQVDVRGPPISMMPLPLICMSPDPVPKMWYFTVGPHDDNLDHSS